MKHSLRILPAAAEDVDTVAGFIARDNLDAALRFYDAIDATYRELRQHPLRWPIYELDHPRLKGIRKRSIIEFDNYLVFYRIDKNQVEVIRVLHGARDILSSLSSFQ
jgi:toxin ParE1/3/4